MKKIALITGITGQDGSYLAELLLKKGYQVHGIKRRTSIINTSRIDHIFDKINLHYGDLSDQGSITRLINEINPDEIYNLGAMSHVKVSFDQPVYTTDINAAGTLRILEAIRGTKIKLYQASSSEIFGNSAPPQNEQTVFSPQSPYAISKLFAYHITKNYREAYNLFVSNGILFNHESPRRGETFVTQKIIKAVVKIELGLQDKLTLGNLDAKRDWGHAKDYVEAMYLILQHNKPDDFVIGTGKTTSVRELLQISFSQAGMDIIFDGKGLNEKGIINGRQIVFVDKKYFRPTDVNILLADITKAKNTLKWKPRYNLKKLITEMYNYEKDLYCRP